MRRHAGRRLFPAVVWVVLTWMCVAVASPAQEQISSTQQVYSLHGTVVNALTGRPVARALVQSSDQRMATLTDSQGRFSLEAHMGPPQTLQGPRVYSSEAGFSTGLFLIARKPGFLADRNAVKPVALDEGTSSRDIELKLMPSSSIEGHVSVAGSDSPHNVRVMLITRQVVEGYPMWMTGEQQRTNSRGEFRFPNLSPGVYSLVAVVWQGDQDEPPPLPNMIRQEYAPLYFGDVHDADSATRIHVHHGETVQADFHMERVNYYPVTIPVAQASGNVAVSVMEKVQTGGYLLDYNARAHAIEGFLPAGSYDVLINSFGATPSVAKFSVHVDGAEVHTAPVTLQHQAVIPVRVRKEFTEKDHVEDAGESDQPQSGRRFRRLFGVGISLFADGTNTSLSAHLVDGQMVLDDVVPGVYHVEAASSETYAVSIAAGGVDLMRNPLIIGEGSVPEAIDVVLRNDTATITGTVSGLDDAIAAYVLFLPIDGPARYSGAFVSGDGKFNAHGLAPGSYRVLAVREMEPRIAYRDEATMHRLEGKGATVTVSGGQSAQVDVPVLDSSELDLP